MRPLSKAVLLVPVCVLVAGCSVQRAQTASKAQVTMVGMPAETVLACMGPPQARATQESTEVWSYNSGGSTVGSGFSHTQSSGVSSAAGTAAGVAVPGAFVASGAATGAYSGQSTSTSFSRTTNRYCIVNIVMRDGAVSAINYSGNTGGVLTQGSECAYAVQNCAR